jgi:uncharacterized protein YdhG (YjbR/CyaY superfamily)
MDDAVRDYVEAITPRNRPLFDRVHRLILEVHPDAEIVISYNMPTYRVGRRALNVGAWKHGLSIYGWRRDRDAGFTARHPELANDKGTIRLGPANAAGITDDELRDFLRASFQS